MGDDERAQKVAAIIAECHGGVTLINALTVAYREPTFSVFEIGAEYFLKAIDEARAARLAAEQKGVAA